MIIAAELFALSDAYDVGFTLRHTLNDLLGREVTLWLYTDSRTLFHAVTNLCSVSERRLLIDISGLRDACRSGDFAEFGQLATGDNLADSMTKRKASQCLVNFMRSCCLQHELLAFVGTGRLPSHQSKRMK